MWISIVLRTATELELPIMDETTQPFILAHELAKIWGVNGAMGESPIRIAHLSPNCWTKWSFAPECGWKLLANSNKQNDLFQTCAHEYLLCI